MVLRVYRLFRGPLGGFCLAPRILEHFVLLEVYLRIRHPARGCRAIAHKKQALSYSRRNPGLGSLGQRGFGGAKHRFPQSETKASPGR